MTNKKITMGHHHHHRRRRHNHHHQNINNNNKRVLIYNLKTLHFYVSMSWKIYENNMRKRKKQKNTTSNWWKNCRSFAVIYQFYFLTLRSTCTVNRKYVQTNLFLQQNVTNSNAYMNISWGERCDHKYN